MKILYIDGHPGTPAVRMTGIVKRFGGLVANDGIDFTVFPGEIHALVGENGAGKSTLMNVLAGVYAPDAGRIELFGTEARFRSPRDAIRARVGMVHQHFAQVKSCTVAQNMALADPGGPFLLDRRELEKSVAGLCERYAIRLDPAALVGDLSVGEKQRLELLRLLARDARVLILDEPTAVFTPPETGELFRILRGLAKKGKAIVFITHKLDEVEACADRVTVLRKGRAAASCLDAGRLGHAELVSLMVGGKSADAQAVAPGKPGRIVLEFKNACTARGGGASLSYVNLRVHEGEIVAVAGVAGNGQRELAETVMRLRPLSSGSVWIGGSDATRFAPARVRERGVGFVPEDRMTLGICPNLSCADNLNLNLFGAKGPFFPDAGERTGRASALAEATGVDVFDMKDPVRFLSGGNVQRAILARELASASKLLVVSQPTRGLDIAAAAAVRRAIVGKRDAGVGVLLISYDLDEILMLADRIAVLVDGSVAANFGRPLPGRTAVGMAMAGGDPHAN